MIMAWIAGAMASLVTGRSAIARSVAALGAGIGSAACLLLGVMTLLTGQALTLNSARMLPVSGLMLRLDGLGAFFWSSSVWSDWRPPSTASGIAQTTMGDILCEWQARCSTCCCWRSVFK